MTAFFVSMPRTYRDLMKPHLKQFESEYEIVKVVELSKTQYENFIEDMLADRNFIDENYDLCNEGKVLKCLLVKQRNGNEGILILPEMGSYVKKAALIYIDEQLIHIVFLLRFFALSTLENSLC